MDGRRWVLGLCRVGGLRLRVYTVDGQKSCMTLTTLNYGNYGIFLIMGNAGFCPATVGLRCWGEGLGL